MIRRKHAGVTRYHRRFVIRRSSASSTKYATPTYLGLRVETATATTTVTMTVTVTTMVPV